MNRLMAVLVLFVLSTSARSAEIHNFRAGLACTDGVSFGWICHETEQIMITGQGSCVYNGEDAPCTWYGFQFEYSGFTEDTVFECTAMSSVPKNIGNPELEEKQNAVSNTYTLDDIEVGEGFYFNPQYRTFGLAEEALSHQYETVECRLDGVKQVEFSREIIFPTLPDVGDAVLYD